MKAININFLDFSADFDKYNNDFVRILSKYFVVNISDKPDYLFCSCFGVKHLKYNCIKIFYTGENIKPNLDIYDYAIGFDKIENSRRYLRWPLYKLFQYRKDLKLALSSNNPYKNVKKDGFCSFVVSNSYAMKERKVIFDKLNEYKKVSSGGKYLNNIGGPVDNKIEFQSRHKFVIAFENSSAPGYTTEKIVQAFASRSIPIYYGNPNIGNEFNEKAFINCHNYQNLDEVVEKVKLVDNNDQIFNEMINEPITDIDLLDEKPLESFLLNIFDRNYTEVKCIIIDRGYKKNVHRIKCQYRKKRFLLAIRKLKKVFNR